MVITIALTLTLWSAQPADMVWIHAPYTTTVLHVTHMPGACMWNAPGWALVCGASSEQIVIEAATDCARSPVAVVVVRREQERGQHYQLFERRCAWRQWLPWLPATQEIYDDSTQANDMGPPDDQHDHRLGRRRREDSSQGGQNP